MDVMEKLMATSIRAETSNQMYATVVNCTTDAANAICCWGSTVVAECTEKLNAAETTGLVMSIGAMSALGGTDPIIVTPEGVKAPVAGSILTIEDEIMSVADQVIPLPAIGCKPPTLLESNVGAVLSTDELMMSVSSTSIVQSTITTEEIMPVSGIGISEMTVNVAGSVGPSALASEGWARDAQMVEGIFRIMEGMEPPWVTLDVLEAATIRFPTLDREMLRRTIMTVMMTQRRCVVRLTRAGLRGGARTDRDGNSYVELDLDFADRYSVSH